jgi:hypothetical protein
MDLALLILAMAISGAPARSEREKSPIHEVCAICNRAATVSRGYYSSRSGTSHTYYFCDLHGSQPPPTDLGILASKGNWYLMLIIMGLLMSGQKRRSRYLLIASLVVSICNLLFVALVYL